jgi:hypothetical protein
VSGTAPSSFVTQIDSPPVEKMIVKDMLRRAWPGLLALIATGAFWGVNGVLSTAFGVGLAVVNAVLAAALITVAARISLAAIAAAAFGGYIVRLLLITVAVLLVVHQSWVVVVPLCIGLLAAHLGLFVWEARFVSTQLAFPGLKQGRASKIVKGA